MTSGSTAIVLGGGGVLGAVQIGMLRALLEADIHPDLIVGTSVGAVNGAALAALPRDEVIESLEHAWRSPDAQELFAAGNVARLKEFVRSGVAAHSAAPLRRMAEQVLGDRRIEDLPTPFTCCAANIEDAAEHWFDKGSVVDAVLASAAVPGLLPPVEIDGRHYLDGGLVHSIPLGRAVQLGADRVFVLQVGRIDQPLRPPRRPWEVAMVAFEISRRHRYTRELAEVPPGVEVHVLPTGGAGAPRWDSRAALRYRASGNLDDRIEAAHRASADYLKALVGGGTRR